MNADRALLLDCELRDRFERPPTVSITVGIGRRWAEKCARCGSTTHEPRVLPGRAGRPRLASGDYIERCLRCGWPWEHEEVEEIRGRKGRTVRANASESRMVLLATLRTAIYPPPRPTRLLPTLPRIGAREWRRVYLGMLQVHVLAGVPVNGLGERFEGELVHRGFGTSDRTVQRILRTTRGVIEARLG